MYTYAHLTNWHAQPILPVGSFCTCTLWMNPQHGRPAHVLGRAARAWRNGTCFLSGCWNWFASVQILIFAVKMSVWRFDVMWWFCIFPTSLYVYMNRNVVLSICFVVFPNHNRARKSPDEVYTFPDYQITGLFHDYVSLWYIHCQLVPSGFR